MNCKLFECIDKINYSFMKKIEITEIVFFGVTKNFECKKNYFGFTARRQKKIVITNQFKMH